MSIEVEWAESWPVLRFRGGLLLRPAHASQQYLLPKQRGKEFQRSQS